MNQMKIYGICGTNGSGKDTLGLFLAEKYGYMFVSVTELLREEARRRSLPVEREVLRTISAEWRRELGLGALVDKALELYKAQPEGKFNGLVMSSLRNPGEVDRIHELGGQEIWTDAEPHVRYKRIISRHRGHEDSKTFEQFMEEEEAEMNQSGDEATLNMNGVRDKSDIFITNSSNDLNEFDAEIEKALGL